MKKSWQHAAFNWRISYSWSKDKQILDADFTYLDVFDNYKKSKQHLVTQEINLQSTATRYWDWTIGTFGFYKDLENNYLATFGKDKHFLLPMPLDEATYYNSTTTKGIAGYGQIGVKELWPGMVLTCLLYTSFINKKRSLIDNPHAHFRYSRITVFTESIGIVFKNNLFRTNIRINVDSSMLYPVKSPYII